MTIDYTDHRPYVTEDTESPRVDFPPLSGVAILAGRGGSLPLLWKFKKDDPGAEVWSINRERIKGATRHFQIHNPEKDRCSFDKEIIGFDCSDLVEKGVKVYTFATYPFEKVRRIFHHSTVDYMLAIADLEGFAKVYMPGLDFTGCRDAIEIHSARYWIGVLEGKGVNVVRSPWSRIFQGELYS